MRASARARTSAPATSTACCAMPPTNAAPSEASPQIRTPAQGRHGALAQRRAPTCRPSTTSISCSASARPAPARPIWPSPTPPNAWSAGRSSGSSCRGPAVEAGERLGFLPGDMREKVDPYLRPLYDALYDVLPPAKVERDLATGVIEIAPLAFMRGRTLAHSFVILDEAQNTTSMQMKMFLTRIGEGSKMAVTGDPSQIDLPPGQRSGLEEAVSAAERRSKASRRSASRPPTWCAAISSRASSTPTTRRSSDAMCSHERPRRQYASHARDSEASRRARASGTADRRHRQEAGRLERVRARLEQAIEAAAAALTRHPACARARGTRGRRRAGRRRMVRQLNADLSRQGCADQRAVLSFPGAAGWRSEGAPYLGDVVLAAETIVREAARARHRAASHHLQHLVVHGLLHLLGFDHDDRRGGRADGAPRDRNPGDAGIADPYAEPLARPDMLRAERWTATVP